VGVQEVGQRGHGKSTAL